MQGSKLALIVVIGGCFIRILKVSIYIVYYFIALANPYTTTALLCCQLGRELLRYES